MASEAGKVKAGEGPATWAEWSFEKAPAYDILLIPGGFGSRKAVADQAFLERLAAASQRARITTTVCTGSALLARTGLLDGRSVEVMGIEGWPAYGTPPEALAHHRLDGASLADRAQEQLGSRVGRPHR